MNGDSDIATARYIPGDIITDILSRLPSKSLLRFKIACKSWYSSISNPDFINLHSKRASQNPKILFITERDQVRLLDSRSSIDASCLPSPLSFRPGSPQYFFCFPKILGSSSGLVCVAFGYYSSNYTNNLFLWNPFTRVYRKIPYLHPGSYWSTSYVHGLGYDPVSNDFKVVLSQSKYEICSFSIKSNSWKSIACPPKLNSGREGICNRATIVNGRFHWLKKANQGDGIEIIAFDSTKDEFLNVSMPRDASSSPFSGACLLEHKGCLCISFSINRVEEIWMLKEHSWSHFFTVSSRFIPPLEGPICVCSSNTQLILNTKKHILRYSMDKGKLEEFSEHSVIYDVTVCAETLISPNHILNFLL